MAPDFECTWWPDGLPTWAGGTGDEWLECCIIHDLGGSDGELFQCVSKMGWGAMALVMVIGLTLFGPAYRLINSNIRRAKRR